MPKKDLFKNMECNCVENAILSCKKELLELGNRKKRILEYSEVEEVVALYQISDEKIIEEILEFLVDSNIDIVRIEEDPIWKCKEELLELGNRKKRILESSEVEEVVRSHQITDEKIIEGIIEYLENNNVDILYIEDETNVSQTRSYRKKYETEEERHAARLKSFQKYRKKQNIQNEYSINQAVSMSQKNPYEKQNEDMELLRGISWEKNIF